MAPKTRSKTSSPAPSPPSKLSTATSSAIATGDDVNARDRAVGAEPRLRAGSRSRTRDEVFDAKYAVDLAVDENVFLFVPNLIGYSRVLLAGASLVYMPYHPKTCIALYAVSCLLDAVDGHAARALGQTSKFGAVLDMVTDRCTTACLLCFLGSTYPAWSILFQFLIVLDFSSHYIHMYSSLVTGSSSHKTVTSDVSFILWYYYNDSRTLFVFCFLDQLFFVSIYLAAFWEKPLFGAPLLPPSLAGPLISFLGNALARVSPGLAAAVLQVVASLLNPTWPVVAAALSFPVMAGKQFINGVQFWKASKILVGIDLIERQAQREAKARAKAN
ncbi:phosphatidylinositol synthase 1 (CDP-alcohol phosphatidyltransferase1) [Cryptotrichosporon argae]